jgi:hypothetical protein
MLSRLFILNLGCQNPVRFMLPLRIYFDENYWIHGSGLNQAGRNLAISTRYQF